MRPLAGLLDRFSLQPPDVAYPGASSKADCDFRREFAGLGEFRCRNGRAQRSPIRRRQNFEVPPREQVKSQCRFISWYEDPNLPAVCNQFGPDCVLWAWNFPDAKSQAPKHP
jgi:hypothetical protein